MGPCATGVLPLPTPPAARCTCARSPSCRVRRSGGSYCGVARYSTAQTLQLCDRGLCRTVAGKFESGARVAGALLSQTVSWANATGSPVPPPPGFDPSLPHAELGLLALHDGDVIAPLETTVVCGLPRHKRGLVFDAWRLVQPWEMAPPGL